MFLSLAQVSHRCRIQSRRTRSGVAWLLAWSSVWMGLPLMVAMLLLVVWLLLTRLRRSFGPMWLADRRPQPLKSTSRAGMARDALPPVSQIIGCCCQFSKTYEKVSTKR